MQKLYPSWYTDKKAQALMQDTKRFGFDCVCLIKAILWGWNGDTSARFGGATYKAHDIPDFTVDGMLTLCTEVSADFSQIEIGEVLWMDGHVGIYVGDGVAVECTAAWDGCVLKTAVANIGTKFDHYSRRWEKHGKLKFIEFEKGEEAEMEESIKEALPVLSRGDVNHYVTTLQTLLIARGYYQADGSFGAITEAAVRAFQRDHGLEATGKVTEADWRALFGGEWK